MVCGAWAWYLYRRCVGRPGWVPSEFTRDLDCIGPERLPVRDAPVLERMEKAAFVWVPRGDEPPVSRFAWPSAAKPDVEVQFLVPARGDGTARVVQLQQSLYAEALPDIGILRERPLEVVIDDASPLARELAFRGSVRVPRMGHFAIQKLLIRERRTADKQVTDLFHVFDLMDRENGLADTVLDDVVDAEGRWKAEVERFVAHLDERSRAPVFLKRLADMYPTERRPPVAYIGREMRSWLDRLSEARGARSRR